MWNSNTGHGHVFPRPDGVKARCGGPAMCKECAHDFYRKMNPTPPPNLTAQERAKLCYDEIAAFGWDITWKHAKEVPADAWPLDIIARHLREYLTEKDNRAIAGKMN